MQYNILICATSNNLKSVLLSVNLSFVKLKQSMFIISKAAILHNFNYVTL